MEFTDHIGLKLFQVVQKTVTLKFGEIFDETRFLM